MILIKMALVEFTEFPTIPTKVTLNEYVDISKLYSTPKSKDFINGILDRLLKLYEKRWQNKERRQRPCGLICRRKYSYLISVHNTHNSSPVGLENLKSIAKSYHTIKILNWKKALKLSYFLEGPYSVTHEKALN